MSSFHSRLTAIDGTILKLVEFAPLKLLLFADDCLNFDASIVMISMDSKSSFINIPLTKIIYLFIVFYLVTV